MYVHPHIGVDLVQFECRSGNTSGTYGDLFGIAATVRSTDADVAGADVVYCTGADVTPAAIGEDDAGVDDGLHLLVRMDGFAVDGDDERHGFSLESWGIRYIPNGYKSDYSINSIKNQ